MTRFRWMTSFALLAVLVAGTCAFAAQGPDGRGDGRAGSEPRRGGPGRGLGAFGLGARDLDLSDAQRQQIRAIVTKARDDSRPLAERLRVATEARRKAMATQPVDESQIRSTTEALSVAEADMAVARARTQGDIFAVLTPDQQAKVTASRQARDTRMAERRERMEQRRQQRRSNQ